jgi:hypothetical protein
MREDPPQYLIYFVSYTPGGGYIAGNRDLFRVLLMHD